MKKVNFSRLDRRLTFGNMTDTNRINPNTGKPILGFVPLTTVWGGRLSLSLTQQLTLAGADNSASTVFFVRHNPDIADAQLVQDGNREYRIDNINFDDNSSFPGFDTIACHYEVIKHG
ncbi:phage head closure protein [Secundilactobacillus kimchicus]|uniref:phage head closure protein n=1 Tax=Secundilactobacillus kimchicus TaxID=528209 RepID=UPI001C0399CC|nr:phage head closure protein [Secundilactobacillus kimchicus]